MIETLYIPRHMLRCTGNNNDYRILKNEKQKPWIEDVCYKKIS